MAASFVQSKSIDNVAAGTTTSLSYTSACTSGSLLVATSFWTSASATGSVSDPTNGTWNAVGSTFAGLTGLSAQSFYVVNTGTTALSVTITTSASVSERALAIHEYTGVNTLEQHTEGFNNSTSTPALTLTPNSSSDLAYTWIVCGGHVNSGPTGFVVREQTNFGNNGTADDLTPTGGSALTATWNASNNTNDLGLIIFSQVSSGSSPLTLGLLGVGS